MNHQKQTLEELQRLAPALTTKKALVGIDGFVDKIVHPVAQRNGPGKDFTRIEILNGLLWSTSSVVTVPSWRMPSDALGRRSVILALSGKIPYIPSSVSLPL
ncbi:MAG: hypothetical protein ACPGC0_00430 [Opitutales bacterium]